MYQKELLGCFSEDIKMSPSHKVLNWYTSKVTVLHICIKHGPTYIPMLILWYFEYTTVFKILSENKTSFKIAALGLQCLCKNRPIHKSQRDPVRVCSRKIKCSLMHLGNAFCRCINAVRCVKKTRSYMYIHKMQRIIFVNLNNINKKNWFFIFCKTTCPLSVLFKKNMFKFYLGKDLSNWG